MKHSFLFLSFLILLSSCYNVERDCSDFKTGLFYSEVIIDEKIYTSTFARTDSLQVEFYDGKVDSTHIRWINDCEVVYKTINPKNMAERKDVHLKILKTTDSSYTFEYSYVGENLKQKGIAYKKKQ
ncbi:DNA topoisomerase IV [Olleya sp. YS]|uniref:DNA topoisomerase IV n=1 Tax=Olleya sp. YS TaxID=3028318 RepID=UPI002434368B|nr:DNA topoisomerase IV [Olleya sp. YS]WGD34602.1 DNA topoisomerase IV [Olleya sp. YS]